MPGPGHPGHFPKPTGWVDQPGAPRTPSPGTRPRPEARAAHDEPDEAPAVPGFGGGDLDGAASRAQEASARLAEMLAEDQEEVEEAEDAVAEDIQEISEEIDELSKVTAARDEYLDSLRRLQADFENYKKRVQRQQRDLQERAAEDLVVKLLPVLDNFDLALAHAEAGVEPIYRSLMDVLGAAGLERLEPISMPFDPNEHDAVLHEEGDGAETPEVIEVLRAGYRWKGRVLRPAMVKVKG